MKTEVVFSAILMGCLSVAAGETNVAQVSLGFTLPAPRLRAMSSERGDRRNLGDVKQEAVGTPKLDGVNLGAVLEENSIKSSQAQGADLFSISVRGSDLEMEVYRKLDEGGYLTRPEEPTPLEHFMDRSFSPEVIHFGPVTASCTLYTAIVRKNPLCLLNPLFLFVSW